MKKVEVYDPAMCCPTGICGPSVDPEVLRISGVLGALKSAGYDVTRHSLSQEPRAFVDNTQVAAMLKKEGVGVLPVTFVDGELLSKGGYPSSELLGNALGVMFVPAGAASGPCCGSDDQGAGSCCCGGGSPCC